MIPAAFLGGKIDMIISTFSDQTNASEKTVATDDAAQTPGITGNPMHICLFNFLTTTLDGEPYEVKYR